MSFSVNCDSGHNHTPRGEIVLLENVEVEEGRSQAHGYVHGCHLVFLHRGSDIAEETQQGLQHLSVFIRH